MAKRLFDIACAGLGLLILLPLLIALALWIKWDSPGPVLFRQQRVGRFGKPFYIHKFRSMRVDAPALGPQITVGEDPRITRSGRVLRAAKLDELPQLWDVLRGAMSLVGPRPEVPRYVALYTPEQRELVLSVRPGITDPASLHFRNESEVLARAADPEREYAEVILPAKLKLAGEYVRQASLWTDIRLILATLRRIL
ncbi:sugar transferase [Paucibacter sp. KCTC 42545]|uniref:sugar transferase n=1 Tax=Paucibacter sp. KCTC 42545 TaxID=1768242 RepID=UPI000733BF24|nr:sugar transferase [Paucibacter sp. KCTC 42545]ALT76174.1 sugar transferase [Paucibacter sp. KCTC 42545]